VNKKQRPRRLAAFTLIELMIAVAVVAILTAIAYPSYQDHLRKSRRASAQAFLMEVANRQQQYLLDARNYAVGGDALTTLSLSTPPDVSAHYTITVAPDAPELPPAYTLTATPSSAVQTPDGVLTLDHQGSKTRAGEPGW
jgi:type IV pilus assembly protein PilE